MIIIIIIIIFVFFSFLINFFFTLCFYFLYSNLIPVRALYITLQSSFYFLSTDSLLSKSLSLSKPARAFGVLYILFAIKTQSKASLVLAGLPKLSSDSMLSLELDQTLPKP